MGAVAALWGEWETEDDLGDLLGEPSYSPLGTLSDVTFPAVDLRSSVRIALGADVTADPVTWLWEDIAAFVRWDRRIQIRDGRQDEGGVVGPGSATLTLDNRDGRFSRRNPLGAYYGLLSKNTPIWLSVDPGDGMHTRAEMYVNAWPTRWDRSATDCTVTIECAGILRRLQAGSRSLSAMRRSVLAKSPVAYWSLEDSSTATRASSAIVGGLPMRAPGVVFEGQSDLAGSKAAPTIGTVGSLATSISGLSDASWWHFFAVKSPFFSNNYAIMQAPSATHANWYIAPPFSAADGPYVLFGPPDGVGLTGSILGPNVGAAWENTWHSYGITATQVGSDVLVSFYVDGVLQGTDTAAGTLAAPTSWMGNPNQDDLTSMAHVAFGDGVTLPDDDGMTGYVGEQAHVRIARTCAEENIPFFSVASESVAMGAQPVGSLMTVLREAEAADHGVLYEKGFGLAYQSRAERENAPVAMNLDFDQFDFADEPEPDDDDQKTSNLWTVGRSAGAEATHEETTGPMGTGSDGPGVYDDSTTVNVESDDDLPYQASYLVHLGTVDEDRWPRFDIAFHRAVGATEAEQAVRGAALIQAWTSLGYGPRTNVANPLDQMNPATIDAFIDGHTEAWDSKRWDASINTVPAAPHHVFRLAETGGDTNEFVGYLIPTSCVLAEDLDTTETDVDITTSPLWSTDPIDWVAQPLIVVGLNQPGGGEVMRVTGVSGVGNPQTLTVERNITGIVGGRTPTAGMTVEFVSPGVLGLK